MYHASLSVTLGLTHSVLFSILPYQMRKEAESFVPASKLAEQIEENAELKVLRINVN